VGAKDELADLSLVKKRD